MSLSASQITIAITVHSHREFVKQAVGSAVKQTTPVPVMVVEDPGKDPGLEAYIKEDFASQITYIRSPRWRGLFGIWNACLECCQTEWITILHDDDYLAPNFAAAMIRLAAQAPGRSLYLGQCQAVDQEGRPLPQQDDRTVSGEWVDRTLQDILYIPFNFPGHLFRVRDVVQLGGFRESSIYCGDWEMWAKLFAMSGAAQSGELVAYFRSHGGEKRGTNKYIKKGQQYPSSLMQHKRVLRLMPGGANRKPERREYLARYPFPSRHLLQFGSTWSLRRLRYHAALLNMSKPPNLRYALFQQMARFGGVPFVRAASKVWNLMGKR